MHMVTETYQLRDGEKLTEFYNGIDWESLFEFVRHYYGIGVEQMPTDVYKRQGQECFVSGRRASGSFALRKLDGTVVTNSISFKKLQLLEPATNYLIERM